ncbi:putative E3 ubiquitin-protein ligase UBR7 [Fasciola gigantica]|uniref:Putative E3 ubiquitin-protein ligase UBR7 n=1 Tax=Fasciola gigantica TaxID=46835 RepID=A0A504YQ72_FASGI|nr:putative E3 ubiquitin-protein ligase UBR7 [Fasciola gigantica]
MAADESDGVVDFKDILASMDEEKAVVMGGIDNQAVCSFTKGYMKRQALFTCRTCLDISSILAGFCYPCSVNCHEGHDIIELYTKRNFRCDCGNAKFKGFHCTLWEEKDDENINNQYNTNFSNKYCTCQRPYPDENYEGVEEMIQCGICEDWFHAEHLNLSSGLTVPEEYEEMTCFQCTRKHAFLLLYAIRAKEQPLTAIVNGSMDRYEERKNEVNCEHDESRGKRLRLDPSADHSTGSKSITCHLESMVSGFGLKVESSHQLKLEDLPWMNRRETPSLFWSSGWRERLCSCDLCQDMYKEQRLKFLLDPEDTMAYYLNIGEQKAIEFDKEENDALNAALAELPHAVAINVAVGVNNLRKAIEEFFKQKRDEDHVITEAEVRTFFEKLREQRQL